MLPKIQSGEEFSSARLRLLINDMITCIERNKSNIEQSRQSTETLGRNSSAREVDPECLDVYNTCGCSFRPGDIVDFGDSIYPFPSIDSTGNGSAELPRPAYTLKEVSSSTDPCFFGVICRVIENECSAKNGVKICGVTRVRINVQDQEHTHAVPVSGQTTYLNTSPKQKGARIVRKEGSGTGFMWAWVKLTDCIEDVERCATLQVASGNGGTAGTPATDTTPAVPGTAPTFTYDIFVRGINGPVIQGWAPTRKTDVCVCALTEVNVFYDCDANEWKVCGNPFEQFDPAPCDNGDDPMEPEEGACCNSSTGDCEDGVLAENCISPSVFQGAGTTCGTVVCPLGIESQGIGGQIARAIAKMTGLKRDR